jgi:hypothetical protein
MRRISRQWHTQANKRAFIKAEIVPVKVSQILAGDTPIRLT